MIDIPSRATLDEEGMAQVQKDVKAKEEAANERSGVGTGKGKGKASGIHTKLPAISDALKRKADALASSPAGNAVAPSETPGSSQVDLTGADDADESAMSDGTPTKPPPAKRARKDPKKPKSSKTITLSDDEDTTLPGAEEDAESRPSGSSTTSSRGGRHGRGKGSVSDTGSVRRSARHTGK